MSQKSLTGRLGKREKKGKYRMRPGNEKCNVM